MELKHLKEMKRVYDLNIKDLDREELETLEEINYALQCAINGVSKCAFVFDCRDTQGRKAQIFIKADNRETAIQVFETDYEDYKWWQTSEIKHFC